MMSKTKKVVRINSMRISNFKGIKDLLVDLDGSNAIVKGDNGTGKTTLYDALLWVLFEKDSKGRTDFGAKPVDKDGNEIHHLETSVEVKLSVDGVIKTFKRLLKEKWVSRPGEVTKEYKGNDTQWYVDGLKFKTKKSYNEEIAQIIDEDVFRYITNINHFINMATKDQRKLLTEVAGEVNIDDIINSDVKFKNVEEYLQGQPIDHMIAVLKQNINESKKRNETIPSLIEENFNQIKDFEEVDTKQIEKEISDTKQQLFNVENGERKTELEREIKNIENDINMQRKQHDSSDIINAAKVKLQECESNQKLLAQKVSYDNSRIEGLEKELLRYNNAVKTIQQQQQQLRDKWREVNAKQAKIEVDTSCPTCKQSLPLEDVEQVKQEALEQFNLKKSNEINEINEEGKALGVRVTDGQVEITKMQEVLESANKEREKNVSLLEQADKELAKAQRNLESVMSNAKPYEDTDEYKDLETTLKSLESDLNNIKESSAHIIKDLQETLQGLQNELKNANAINAQKSVNDSLKSRIADLKSEMMNIGQSIIDQEHKLHILQAFNDAQVKQVELNVNQLFSITKFKMFEQQINGGLKDVCQATYNGVAVNKGLNTAATINVGLDIVNALSTYYGVTAPVFIDNAESITNIIDSDSQLIKMYVVQNQKLIVEKEGNL